MLYDDIIMGAYIWDMFNKATQARSIDNADDVFSLTPL